MESQLRDIIEATKGNVDFMENLQTKKVPSGPCSAYDLVYSWTNEDIAGCLNVAGVSSQKALAVLSSGDHPFNLITLGATDVDTFDTNKLTEFYALGFKRAMILKYSYNRFMKIMEHLRYGKLGFADVNDLIKGLFPYMDRRHQIFFQELIDYTCNKKLPVNNLIDFLTRDEHDLWGYQLFGNNYLLSEENYNRLRNNLSKANITFNTVDALDLKEKYSEHKYDAIMLSNILDYFFRFSKFPWTYQTILSYEKDLEILLDKNGVLFLYYVFKTPAPDGWVYPFNRYNIIPEHLEEEELIRFANCYGSDSAVVLKREGSKGRTLRI